MQTRPVVAALLLALPGSGVQAAGELITQRKLSSDLGVELARATLADCRVDGYQVAAVVVDRNGDVQVAMRDDLAPPVTLEIARRKANAVILGGTASSLFRDNRADIRAELNETGELLLMAGAVPVQAGGQLVAAVGVSGAPGGDLDEACAEAGVASIQETLDFAE